jgi:O-antigen biosynthesis protein WbqP
MALKSRGYHVAKRALDIAGVLLLAPLMVPLATLVAIAVKLTSPGPALYWSERIGAGGRPFQMPKFRTMRVGTPVLATHLLTDPQAFLTPIGSFLRKSSLDEIPQLWSILRGQMTLVGPRPALFNQDDLIAMRAEQGVDKLVPGITGLAQMKGRDDLSLAEKVAYDRQYLENRSLRLDLGILLGTAIAVVRRDGIGH